MAAELTTNYWTTFYGLHITEHLNRDAVDRNHLQAILEATVRYKLRDAPPSEMLSETHGLLIDD